jgi:hypothetical protein
MEQGEQARAGEEIRADERSEGLTITMNLVVVTVGPGNYRL